MDSWFYILSFAVILYFASGDIKKVLVYFLYMFFQNYNTSYPVFSKFQIGELKAGSIILSQEWNKLIDKYQEKIEKSKSNSTYTKDEDKRLFEETWEPHYKSNWLEEGVNLMINANIEVASGKKTITEAKDEVAKKIKNHDYFKKMEQHYKSYPDHVS